MNAKTPTDIESELKIFFGIIDDGSDPTPGLIYTVLLNQFSGDEIMTKVLFIQY